MQELYESYVVNNDEWKPNNTFLILLTFHLGTFQFGPYDVQPEHASEILRNFGRIILLFLKRLKFAFFKYLIRVHFYIDRIRYFYATEIKIKVKLRSACTLFQNFTVYFGS